MASLGRSLIQYNLCSYKKKLGHRCTQRKDQVKTLEEDKPRRETLGETNPVDTRVSDF